MTASTPQNDERDDLRDVACKPFCQTKTRVLAGGSVRLA
jgi:hypothetical protein